MIRPLMICASLMLTSCGEPTPVPVKRPPLANIAAFAPEHREAVSIVTSYIAQNGEDPLDFFAEVSTSPNSGELVIRLWHASTFDPGNREVIGNPGGKNRDVYYDIKSRKVTRMLFWQ